jgi:hypothetical protein
MGLDSISAEDAFECFVPTYDGANVMNGVPGCPGALLRRRVRVGNRRVLRFIACAKHALEDVLLWLRLL